MAGANRNEGKGEMIEEKANSPRGERHTHTQVYGKRKSLNIPRRTNFFAII